MAVLPLNLQMRLSSFVATFLPASRDIIKDDDAFVHLINCCFCLAGPQMAIWLLILSIRVFGSSVNLGRLNSDYCFVLGGFKSPPKKMKALGAVGTPSFKLTYTSEDKNVVF